MSGDAPSALTALVRGRECSGFAISREAIATCHLQGASKLARLSLCAAPHLKSLTRVAQAQRGAGEAFPYCRAPSHCRAHQHWRGRAAEI